MKIIDLLNKIANGEEVPEHIKIEEDEWYFYKTKNTYGDKKGAWIVFDWYVEENKLNTEVEILEEEKKIPEKLYGIVNLKENTERVPNNEQLMFKINEIIDYLKSKGE